ncbi:hypothetical protein QBC34DRAFT_65474 [Podospora aff. communis PSN243]|uniref:Uncharacterized protein n=1 Tax=Podospora aff. communis PSN243 TaxID=3040156 RepID=A0AAV9GSM9_9PEZI|nr:hypothetical protein QBC34DRAFT_65474 [Podospora aff. communis PSN243]
MMSFATDFHVPGAYRFDSTTRAGSALNAGIFRPPSPSNNLAKSTGSLYSDISMSNNTAFNGTPKRKRQSTRESTPVDWNMNMDGANDGRQDGRKLAGGRQIRYTLAGQINATPLGAPNGADNGILEDSVYSDIDYRRALGPQQNRDEAESPSVQFETESPLSDERKAPTSTGWSTLALQVVGRVWEFCKTGSFRGFHAGGGAGYDIQPPKPATTPVQSDKAWCNEHDIPSLPKLDTPSHVPSQFPRQDLPQQDFSAFSPEYREASTPESTPRPAAKRRQVSGHNEELKKNWVLVDEPGEKPRSFGAALSTANARPNAPRRSGGYYAQTAASSGRRINFPVSRLGGGTPSSLPRSRASLRISHAGSPNLATREPASFAAPRSPVTRTTPSRIPVPISSQPANPFVLGGSSLATMSSRPSSRQSRVHSPIPPSSPTKGHHRRHSNASAAPTMRRSRTAVDMIDVDDIKASPRLDAEAKQLAQKKLAVERDTDLRVDAFNARLLSMIRQGKEALGTRVEVMDDVGGGWEDDYDD